MPNSINSLSPNFRDFLLNRNLVTDTVTANGLETLLNGIGLPVTSIGTPPESVQPSPNIISDGSLYKELNVGTNKFKGSDNDYELININYNSSVTPPASAFIYSVNYATEDGILNDTLNTPANGPFQGGNIRKFSTSRNLYNDPSMQILRSLDDIFAPNVQYTNYQEINNGIVNNSIDILGSILTGGGVGISSGSGANGSTLVPDFDLRATLLGRVLGGTGVISDTPLGQAGAKYLALSLANNAAFGLQQETIGHLNLNPLNIAMNGANSIVIPNYSITVPKSSLGRVLDYGARVLGFEPPVSLYSRDSSIFTSENPISNIDRALSQISNTGKGQVLAMFANIKENLYRPAFSDERIQDKNQNGGGAGANPNLYAFGTTDGKIIDFLNTTSNLSLARRAELLASDGNLREDELNVNSPISQSNYNLDGLIENSGFNGVQAGEVSPLDYLAYTNDGANTATKFSWGDKKDNKNSLEIFPADGFKSPNSILTKTQKLFNSGRMRTLASGEVGTRNNMLDPVQTAVRQGGLISKGSGVLTENANNGNFNDVDNVFCRTWSTFNRYNQVQDLQKSSGIDTRTAFRSGYDTGDSVLGDNGFVKIGPYIGDVQRGDIKNFMFSIENLAWADNQELLTDCEKGPGDLITGHRGRIMWFPPYDLSVSESTSVNWESTNFIGRGEPIYTYSNTERTGTLQFKIVVDHPSYLNALKSETDDYIASFFAGCQDIDPILAEKLNTVELRDIEVKKSGPPVAIKIPDEQSPNISKFTVYLPNDVAIPYLYPTYENKYSEELGTGVIGGTTEDSGTVSITKATSTDRNNFGLNGDKNDGLEAEGGWITPAGQARIKKALIEECPACTIEVKGYASYQGEKLNPKGNEKIQIDRAKELRKWIEDNILIDDVNIKSGKITSDDRFKPYNEASQKGGVTGCQDFVEGINDDFCLKEARKSVAKFTFDPKLASKLTDNEKDPVVPPDETWRVSKKITNRFYTECNYFEKLKQEDSIVYSTLKEKLKFFHPAFHAITPEGLNSRLTFLQQCTRQGPTNIANTPDNLAFGRPPVCILRLGDFYHTKIVIDNVGITYEPLVWDLNPEGIGVQPMIATVDLSFKMIGGQSMKGPLNKLQNAVSFNFFGNTQIYDERADKIVKNTKEIISEERIDGINANGPDTVGTDQTALANTVTPEEQPKETNDTNVIKNIQLKSYSELPDPLIAYELGELTLMTLTFTYNQGENIPFVLDTTNPELYIGHVLINSTVDGVSGTLTELASISLLANNSTSVIIDTSEKKNKIIGSDVVEFSVVIGIPYDQAVIADNASFEAFSTIEVQWSTGHNNKLNFGKILA